MVKRTKINNQSQRIILVAPKLFSVGQICKGIIDYAKVNKIPLRVICEDDESFIEYKNIICRKKLIYSSKLLRFSDLNWIFSIAREFRFLSNTNSNFICIGVTLKSIVLIKIATLISPTPKIIVNAFRGLGRYYKPVKKLEIKKFNFFENNPYLLKNFMQKIFLFFISFSVSGKNRLNWFINSDDLNIVKNICKKNIHKNFLLTTNSIDTKLYSSIKRVSNKNEFRVVMIARLMKSKGFNIALEASLLLKKKYPKILFNFTGSTEASGLSQSEIKKWSSASNITINPYTRNVVNAYRNADIAILPTTYREGFPRSVMEPMAAGIPVITTNIPGSSNILKNKYNSLIIKPSAEDLAKAIICIYENNELKQKLSKNGRETVCSKLDHSFVAEQVFSKINTLM